MSSNERKEPKPSLLQRLVANYRYRKMKRQSKMAKKYLQSLDMTLKALNMSRQKRKQFWRDFIKFEDMREGFFNTNG